MKTKIIEVSERYMSPPKPGATLGGHHACLKGNRAIWSAGDTANEAIGSLLRTHPEEFGIQIEDLGMKGR